MSKSLGNVVTVRDALKVFGGRAQILLALHSLQEGHGPERDGSGRKPR